MFERIYPYMFVTERMWRSSNEKDGHRRGGGVTLVRRGEKKRRERKKEAMNGKQEKQNPPSHLPNSVIHWIGWRSSNGKGE